MIMDVTHFIENFTASLVREYLHRKGLKTTLDAFELEFPRGPLSINNTSRLIKCMKLENIIKRNKNRNNPYKSILEVVVHHIKLHKTKVKRKKLIISNHYSPSILTLSHLKSLHTLLSQKGHNVDFIKLIKIFCGCCQDISLKESYLQDIKITLYNNRSLNLGRQNCIKRDENGEPSYDFDEKFYYAQKEPQIYNEKETSTLTEKENVLKSYILGQDLSSGSEIINNTFEELSISSSRSSEPDASATLSTNSKRTLNANRSTSPSTQSLKSSKKLNINIDTLQSEENVALQITETDFNDPANNATFSVNASVENQPKTDFNNPKENNIQQLNTTVETIIDSKPEFSVEQPLFDDEALIKAIILANNKSVSNKWLGEGIFFSQNPEIPYGLVQRKVGCSGILAPINAFMIKEMLFHDNKSEVEYLRPSLLMVEAALVKAITDILWQAGNNSACFTILKNNSMEINNIQDVVENSDTFSFTSKESLQAAVGKNITHYTQSGGHGCILFLMSIVRSRGVRNVIDDMNGVTSLISSNGYSTQELINLLVTGRAVSHVFDNCMKLKNATIKGIPKRSDIGLLSIKEHYKCCKVGSYLKTPRFPIWLVHNENHWTILFACQKKLVSDWKAERKFILFYYDPLEKTSVETKLVIDTTGQEEKQNDIMDNTNSPLEHCIKTKWKGANIIWK